MTTEISVMYGSEKVNHLVSWAYIETHGYNTFILYMHII